MANHYTFGIGQPHTEVEDDLPPVAYDETTQSLVSGDRTVGTPSLLLVSTAAIASVTGTVTETALRTVAIPDGAMGPNSRLIIRPAWQYTNSANNKIIAVKFGTTLGGATTLYTRTRTTTNAESPLIELVNRGAVNSQVVLYGQTGTYSTAQSANNATTTYDFATSGTNVYVVGTLANTGETIQVDSLWVEIVNPYV